MGNKDRQDEIRQQSPNKTHCPYLRRDPNACIRLPDGDYGDKAKPGDVCPHNVYVLNADMFEARELSSESLDRIMRLVHTSEAGLISIEELDTCTISELLAARNEIERMKNERQKREYDKAKHEAEAKRNKEDVSTIQHFEDRFTREELERNG